VFRTIFLIGEPILQAI